MFIIFIIYYYCCCYHYCCYCYHYNLFIYYFCYYYCYYYHSYYCNYYYYCYYFNIIIIYCYYYYYYYHHRHYYYYHIIIIIIIFIKTGYPLICSQNLSRSGCNYMQRKISRIILNKLTASSMKIHKKTRTCSRYPDKCNDHFTFNTNENYLCKLLGITLNSYHLMPAKCG